MNYSLFLGFIACAFLANVSSAPVDCDGALPSDICDHLNKLQTRIGKLAKNSIAMIAKSVQDSAAKNAALFAKTMEIVNATSSKKSMNASEVATIISGLEGTFEKAEEARDEALENAVKSIQEAALKIGNLIERIIAEAAEGDHSDARKFQERLKGATKKSHQKIKAITFNAISKVQRGNAKIEGYVVRILKKLGHTEASKVQAFVDVLSMDENVKIADAGEQEIEADFDAVADEAYELILLSDSGNAKRGLLQDWWNKIKEKLVSLANLILNEVKKAIEIMWPQIKEKLTEIVQIILNTAKQAIVNIAGEMIFVTLPPSLR